MKIYGDTPVCKWHIEQLNLEFSSEIVAGAPAVFHMPMPMHHYFQDKISPWFQEQVSYAVNHCSKVVILVSELHEATVEFMLNYQHDKIKYFICGHIQGHKFSQWMDWFITTREFYRDVDLLDQLDPYSVKPKYFDILLGWPKLHRDVIFNFINNTNLQDQVIMTYFQDRSKPVSQQGIWDIDFSPGIMYTVTQINVQNRYASISQIIPLSIYNQTAYTVVAETNYSNHYSFYTEKIVKPILAERLFIVFSGQHYLRNLRSLGFKTFDGIIDESYDSIADNDLRFKLACAQIQYLINQPQEEILAKIKHITEHNKQVMLTTNWLGDYLREFQEFLLDQQEQN